MPLSTSTTTSPPADSTSSAATHWAASASSSSTPEPPRRLDDPPQRRRAVRGPVRRVHRHRSHLFAADRPAIRRRRPRALRSPLVSGERTAMRRPMAAETWISVDVETSGPTPHTGSLLSIGACLVDDPDQGIELLLRPEPGLPWSDDAEAIHGLDRATLERDGLEPAEAMTLLERWIAQGRPGGLAPGVRRPQRPLRLDVRRRRLLAAPGPEPVRAQRAGHQGALPRPPPARGGAMVRDGARPHAGALPGRPCRTRTPRSRTPASRRPSSGGSWTGRAAREADAPRMLSGSSRRLLAQPDPVMSLAPERRIHAGRAGPAGQ